MCLISAINCLAALKLDSPPLIFYFHVYGNDFDWKNSISALFTCKIAGLTPAELRLACRIWHQFIASLKCLTLLASLADQNPNSINKTIQTLANSSARLPNPA